MIIYGTVILGCYIFEGLLHKHIRNFLPIITLIFLVIMMGGNTNNPDSTIYYNMYNASNFFEKDYGFGVLIYLSNKCGLDINYFRLLVAIIGLFLISNSAKLYLKKPMIFYGLYFLYPFMMDVVQMRNFLAMSIIVFALRFLILDKKNEKKNQIIYLLLTLLAASMQKTALVYLPIVFFNKIEKKSIIKGIIVITSLISLMIGVSGNSVNVIANYLLNNVSDSLSGSAGFFTRNTNFGWIILWGEQFANVSLVFISKKIFLKADKNKIESNLNCEKMESFIDLLLWINIYLFCFCPLYVININFYRIMSLNYSRLNHDSG